MEPTKEQFYLRRIAQLEAENAELRQQVVNLTKQVASLTEQVAKLSKNSSNSSTSLRRVILLNHPNRNHRTVPASKVDGPVIAMLIVSHFVVSKSITSKNFIRILVQTGTIRYWSLSIKQRRSRLWNYLKSRSKSPNTIFTQDDVRFAVR